jgi:hypothetical protein
MGTGSTGILPMILMSLSRHSWYSLPKRSGTLRIQNNSLAGWVFLPDRIPRLRWHRKSMRSWQLLKPEQYKIRMDPDNFLKKKGIFRIGHSHIPAVLDGSPFYPVLQKHCIRTAGKPAGSSRTVQMFRRSPEFNPVQPLHPVRRSHSPSRGKRESLRFAETEELI